MIQHGFFPTPGPARVPSELKKRRTDWGTVRRLTCTHPERLLLTEICRFFHPRLFLKKASVRFQASAAAASS